MRKKIDKNINIYYDNERYIPLFKEVLEDKVEILKVLKDDNRSKVLLIEYLGEKLVLKEPIEKNTRKWQKLLSIFRGSPGLLEYKNSKRVLDSGFKGSMPLLAIEVKEGLLLKKSYFISSFIDGNEGTYKDLEVIYKTLTNIHKKGYLHGDSQLVNFMVDKNNEVYLIDCKLKNNIYGGFGSKYECIYLEESCHRDINIYSKNDFYYMVAKAFNNYLHWYGGFKKKVRGK